MATLPTLFRQRGMAAALFATYATVMAAKCALPAVMAQLTSPTIGLQFTSDTFTAQQLLARQLALSTLAISLGKVVLGPIIDHVGGVRALQIALTTLMVLMGMIATSQSFLFFSICWIVVDFIFSSCWAACINAIHQTFPRRQWGQRISILAIAARTGNASAFAFFAWLLHVLEHVKRPWRVIFAISALLQLIPISLLTYFGNEKASSSSSSVIKNHAPSVSTSLAVLRREAFTPEFWCHLVSRSVLMVFASFLLFVPTLMHVVYGASNALSAQCGSLYALGCLLAVSMGGGYSKLRRRGKLVSVVTCMGAATFASMAQLYHMMGRWTMSTNVSMACFFLWGLAFSVPFYLPPSLYALARGGQESSATIADVFDIGGFGLLALFNGYVASIAQQTAPSAWITTFRLTTACSVASLLSLSLGVLLE
jgi:MFS family permease